MSVSSGKLKTEFDSGELSEGFRESVSCEVNKPDFRELETGSPNTPLRNRRNAPATSSSSSSSGSVSGKTGGSPGARKSDSGSKTRSGELSGSSGSSPTVRSAGNTRNAKKDRGKCDSGSGVYVSVSSSPVHVLPAGNICPSGKIPKTGMLPIRSERHDILATGMGQYGHGSVMRAGAAAKFASRGGAEAAKGPDPEELRKAGNEHYRKGNFAEALTFYDRAIAVAPDSAACRSNRGAALMGLGRLTEAVRECEEAVRLDPKYLRAHLRLGSLFLRFGQVENARKHLCFDGKQPDASEFQKLQDIEKHLNKCAGARTVLDWTSVLKEANAAIEAGAIFCPELFMCRTEAYVKLKQLADAEASLAEVPKLEPSANSFSQIVFFGMFSEAYMYYVRSYFDLAFGRFENAVKAAQKALQFDSRNLEIAVLNQTTRLIAKYRAQGNDLFKSERYSEACSAYGEGLVVDSSNSVLYCNRAACWFKLGKWEQSLYDCNEALKIQPNYTKALLRRAASNSKLENWADAVKDYERLSKELPDDNDVAESLCCAQIALKRSRGEEVYNVKYGNVEKVSNLDQFKTGISIQGMAVVLYQTASNPQCKQMSALMDELCNRYPTANFLTVDIKESPALANNGDVKKVPTFKIFKNGARVKELVCPTQEMLLNSLQTSFHGD